MHSIWAKFGMLDAEVVDNFILGFDEGSLGDTRTYVGTIGHTWTLSPTLVLDGNFGINRMEQTVTGPDYGDNFGTDRYGIPGTNGDSVRASGLPFFDTTGFNGHNQANDYDFGTTPNWMPLFRTEQSFTFSSALTKVMTKHELRFGIDVVKHELDHFQAEFGSIGGVRGRFSFANELTGIPGYVSPGWNSFGGFLLGQQSIQAKDVQEIAMTRPRVADGGLRSRPLAGGRQADAQPRPALRVLPAHEARGQRHRAARLQHLRGAARRARQHARGPGHRHPEVLLRPPHRRHVSAQRQDRAARRLRPHRQPAALVAAAARLVPLRHLLQPTAEQFGNLGTLEQGIPAVPVPDLDSGRVKLPANTFMRSPSIDDVDRAILQQANVAVEQRLPLDLSLEVAFVHGRSDGGYADANVNYGEPGGGQAARQLFSVAGTTDVWDWAARTKRRYNALQIALNRPYRNGLLLKGAYTLSEAKNETDEDGWTTLPWSHPSKLGDNFALSGEDRTHVFQLGFLYDLPFAKNSSGLLAAIVKDWQINGIFSAYSGTPFSVGGTNTALNCQGCSSIGVLINAPADTSPSGSAGSSTEPWYDTSLFTQPTGTGLDGFGTSKRNQFRSPSVWNVDFGDLPLVPGRQAAARAAHLGHQPVQPHELGSPGDRCHGRELHDLHPERRAPVQHDLGHRHGGAADPDRAAARVLGLEQDSAGPGVARAGGTSFVNRAGAPRGALRPVRFLPDASDAVLREDCVCRDDPQLLLERLRDQQPVERVAVVEGQARDAGRVPQVDRQGLKAVDGELLGHEAVERALDSQLAEAHLDRELPGARDAHEALVARAPDGATRLSGELPACSHPPQEGVGVEQELHRT